MIWKASAKMPTRGSNKTTGTATRLALLIVMALVGFAPSAAAQSEDEVEFARGVVKARLEVDRTGTTYRWTNPVTGNVGELTIVETQILGNNLPCRWYRWTMQGDSGEIDVDGKGCRLANGDWLLEETAIITKLRRVRVEVPQPSPTPEPEPEPEPAAASPSADPLGSVDYTLPERSAAPAGGASGQ